MFVEIPPNRRRAIRAENPTATGGRNACGGAPAGRFATPRSRPISTFPTRRKANGPSSTVSRRCGRAVAGPDSRFPGDATCRENHTRKQKLWRRHAQVQSRRRSLNRPQWPLGRLPVGDSLLAANGKRPPFAARPRNARAPPDGSAGAGDRTAFRHRRGIGDGGIDGTGTRGIIGEAGRIGRTPAADCVRLRGRGRRSGAQGRV